MKAYYRETVAKLVEYDLRHRTSLAHTLEVFLGSYGNKKEAAAKLFVHRNTLSRQIKKIEELLGVDLNDKEVRFRLQLGLKVRHLVL
ncbi:PucR family transcriptional regulator, purine catabolism regulatory protein [Candidatus Hakubella thermalkaliphila]|uniref:PucR family transcriptional regulator, purine catabolism regulatory protein n=1 Tax=Candidatus Hakubella thermalkaliphila TaxID=2754717 RepID=A0A6V8PP79_9ACTN|nr:helix-turn-helix domain-containing protein [Candidatus Hakubella thermalkaliphila]GFP28000.1 PucR family transcriptional regulator, purine catabolism regulatory protein [Candidatus Hakubella thermalkaliphila]GFP32024.1 PucR family transcriptional regulator, purine catabolism regulatory protein [Candidatus Hakubella thermalkaliphila]GFP34462.1 PucR family transcriptional regulator, purine catabolism regulatory protein [Candidatus Hakubella thermalkaliphila]